MGISEAIYKDLLNHLNEHYPTKRSRKELASNGDMPGFFERWKHEWEQRDGFTEEAWDTALRRLEEEHDETLVPAITARS